MASLTPLHDNSLGALRVVGLMSGSGSNIRRLLEHERSFPKGESPFHFVALFSDSADSQAIEIGRDFDLPVIVRDIRAFYRRRNKPRNDMALRRVFDEQTLQAIKPYEAQCAAYAGYMSIATEVLTNAILGVNVHPADLSILNAQGERKYTGDHAVKDAIAHGETTIRSTTHIIEPKVDGGRILMISEALAVEKNDEDDPNDEATLKRLEAINQERLKEAGDWVVFPKTLEAIGRGHFAQNAAGELYFKGEPIPDGMKL